MPIYIKFNNNIEHTYNSFDEITKLEELKQYFKLENQ